MISIGIHVSAEIRMGRRITFAKESNKDRSSTGQSQNLWSSYYKLLSLSTFAIFVSIWLDSERWDHCGGTWNNNAARATVAVWECKIIRGFNWWPNWLSMRFQYKLLSQHSARYERCLRSVNSICQTDLFAFVGDRDFSTDSRVPTGGNGRAITRAPEGEKLDYTRYPDYTVRTVVTTGNCTQMPEEKYRSSNNCRANFPILANCEKARSDLISDLILNCTRTNNFHTKRTNCAIRIYEYSAACTTWMIDDITRFCINFCTNTLKKHMSIWMPCGQSAKLRCK